MSIIAPPTGDELARIEAILGTMAGLPAIQGLSYVPAGELVAIMRYVLSAACGGVSAADVAATAAATFTASGWTTASVQSTLLAWRRLGVFNACLPAGGLYPDDLKWAVNPDMVRVNPRARPFAALNGARQIWVPIIACPILVGGTSMAVFDANVSCS